MLESMYSGMMMNFALASKWCLRELAHIVDNVSKSEDEKCILPIFLDVEPDDVKLKTPIYSNALLEHERKFPDKVEAWRAALGAVGKIKGWKVTSSQAEIVKLVVKEVLGKLKIKQKSVTKHLVGLDGRIKELTKLLDVNHDDVRLIGIYGMGGIGKTTIAMVIFNQLCSLFGKCCSFLEGVRERLTKEGIVPLQKKLLSDIGGSTSVGEINDSEEGMRRIGATLNKKKALIVLDDVDEKVPIKNLIGNSKLYRGSRIIITTRDKLVLKVEGFEDGTRQYEMLKMDVDYALQLFCRHAFSRDSPLDGYCELSSDIVLSTGGLPLAIEVIGSLLNGKDQEIWKETVDKLREVPEKKILEKLRISYDDLENHHKQIFLDIACFFCNENKTDAIYMWTACKFYPNRGIEVLTNRCLVKILDNDQFQMHDQLIALGRQIVREDSPHDQSRLWIAEEALQIMRTNEVKHKVQALELFTDGPPIEIRNEDFERLPNLRILDLKWGTFAGNFTSYSNLRWFSWYNLKKYHTNSNFNLDFRAGNLYMDQLVVCKLNWIDFKDDSKAWDLIKRAQKLKVLSISWCSGITTIPDISRCSSLERLTLTCCHKLKRIESFFGDLQSLIELKITGCFNLTNLPEEVGALVKLKRLTISGCMELSELPSSLGNLTSLMELDLSGPKIRELPNFIGQLKSLRILRFPLNSVQFSEHHDWQLPSGISTLVNLEELDLSRHNGMKGEIPVGEQTCLRILNLRQTGIGRIPRTINKLHHLQTLDLTDCNEIQELLELPTSLNYLFLRSLSLHSVPNLSKLTNLVELVLSDGDPNYHRKPKLFPGCDIRWIGNLSKLEWLELDLLNVPVPPELASLSLLKEVRLTRMDLKPLALLPSSCWSLRNLSTLDIFSCEAEDISLDGLPQLESISCGCKRLKRLSIPSELRKLRDVEVLYCPELVELRVVGLSKSLKDLSFCHCKSLTKISGLQYLKNLKKLILEHCKVTDMEGLDELESLETLSVIECRSLRRLIGASRTKIPDNCYLYISECGYSIKDSEGMPLKRYREEVLLDTSKKISITIRFQLGVKKSSERFEFVGGIEREKKGVDPYLLTYEGLVADLKNFGFGLKRMWFSGSLDSPFKERICLSGFLEIKSDEEVNRIFKHSSINGLLIHLFVEGWVHSEWEGEYDDEMMEMLREQQRMKTDVYSDEDEVKWWGVSRSDSDSDLDFDSTSFADLVPSPMSFTIRFHLGGKKSSWGCIGGVEREKEGVDSSLVTYEGLIADVKNFGFRMKRMWYEIPCGMQMGITSDEKVNTMLGYASRRTSPIHLVVEGEVDSEWEGEYDDEMMKMLREQRTMKTDVCSDEDGAKGGASCPNEDSNSASVGGESETHGSSSVDDFELEWGNTKCFEAMTSIVEKKLDTVKNQVELHEESRDKKDSTLNRTPKSMRKTKPGKTRITDRKSHHGFERTLLATD